MRHRHRGPLTVFCEHIELLSALGEKRFRGDSENYVLRLPNLEVREAFYMNILAEFTESGVSILTTDC